MNERGGPHGAWPDRDRPGWQRRRAVHSGSARPALRPGAGAGTRRAAGGGRAPARRAAEQASALPAELGPSRDQRAVPRFRGRTQGRRRAASDAVHGRRLPRRGGLGGTQARLHDDGLQLADPDRACTARPGTGVGQRGHPGGCHGPRPHRAGRRHPPRRGHRGRLLHLRRRRARSRPTSWWTRWAAAPRSATGWWRRVGPSPRCRPWTPRSPTPRAGTSCPPRGATRVLVVAAPGDHADPGQRRASRRARVPGELLPDRGEPGHRLHGLLGDRHAAHHGRVRRVGPPGADTVVRGRDGALRPHLGGAPDPIDREHVATVRPLGHPADGSGVHRRLDLRVQPVLRTGHQFGVWFGTAAARAPLPRRAARRGFLRTVPGCAAHTAPGAVAPGDGQGPGLRVRGRHREVTGVAASHRRGRVRPGVQPDRRCRPGGRGGRRALRQGVQHGRVAGRHDAEPAGDRGTRALPRPCRLGRRRVPFGFDPRSDPPATDYSPDGATTTAAAR